MNLTRVRKPLLSLAQPSAPTLNIEACRTGAEQTLNPPRHPLSPQKQTICPEIQQQKPPNP